MKTIVLKFSGPLQSWGIGSHFESRDTARYPTKSAVIGLIGSSMGYRRDETEKIQKLNELSFGVRIEQKGSLLKDYHIAQSQNQTYVTNRYYLQDAVFLVMISHEDLLLIDSIAKSLQNPVFPLFMGRRCSPVLSDFYQGVIEENLLSALKSYKWLASEWYKSKLVRERKNHDSKLYLDAYVDAELVDDNASPPFLHRDAFESFSSSYRIHGYRAVKPLRVEIRFSEENMDTEHDAFQSIGGL